MHGDPLTLTAKVFLFLQLEVAVLTGVAGMSASVGLAVTLSTFLDKTHGTVIEGGRRSSTDCSGESQLDEQMRIASRCSVLTC